MFVVFLFFSVFPDFFLNKFTTFKDVKTQVQGLSKTNSVFKNFQGLEFKGTKSRTFDDFQERLGTPAKTTNENMLIRLFWTWRWGICRSESAGWPCEMSWRRRHYGHVTGDTRFPTLLRPNSRSADNCSSATQHNRYVFSRPYISNGRAIGMAVVRLSVSNGCALAYG